MNRTFAFSLLGAASLAMLSACGGSSGSSEDPNARGALQVNPPQGLAGFTAAEFNARLDASASGKQLLAVAGAPKCGINIHYLQYGTVGGANEPTNATGALMVPTGSDPACTGPRPVLLYAHGTSTDRGFNIADISDGSKPGAGEGTLVAAMYAAQGYTVVAPNYAGYDRSTLSYHPYLNADQQGKDMVDALTAARKALPNVGGNDSGKLLVAGYSQGGYVAVAAHRALQQAGIPVTATAPLSAPTAISLLLDYSTQGAPAIGGTIFTPLISTSWQKQFGNLYTTTADIYESQYAAGIETLLPSTQTITQLFQSGRLPQQALYPANAQPGPASPAFAAFYGAGNLVRQSFLTASATDIAANRCPGNAFPPTAASRASANPLGCTPQNAFRKAAVANDLRSFVPNRPTFFCGGALDPTVNFESTLATAGSYVARGVPASVVPVLDLEAAPTGATDPYTAAKAGFAQAKAATAAAAGGTVANQQLAVTLAYHGSLVPPFCNAAARGFFQQVLASGQ